MPVEDLKLLTDFCEFVRIALLCLAGSRVQLSRHAQQLVFFLHAKFPRSGLSLGLLRTGRGRRLSRAASSGSRPLGRRGERPPTGQPAAAPPAPPRHANSPCQPAALRRPAYLSSGGQPPASRGPEPRRSPRFGGGQTAEEIRHLGAKAPTHLDREHDQATPTGGQPLRARGLAFPACCVRPL